MIGYDSVAHLTDDERNAIPYVILANQFVCVAWFAEQDKYAELLETNKKMTLWLIRKLEELKDIWSQEPGKVPALLRDWQAVVLYYNTIR